MEENSEPLIQYNSGNSDYVLTQSDFKKVEEYCENECMGIKFLINANFLREIVNAIQSTGEKPPFTNEIFNSEELKEILAENDMLDSMVQKFGTDDVSLVSKIVIKSTYNFLHKI